MSSAEAIAVLTCLGVIGDAANESRDKSGTAAESFEREGSGVTEVSEDGMSKVVASPVMLRLQEEQSPQG